MPLLYGVFLLLSFSINVNSVTLGNLCTNTVGVKCGCTYDGAGRLEVNCSKRTLDLVPTGIQSDAVVVDFSDNIITTIELDDFTGLNQLSTLYLQRNLISTIVQGAFDKLYKLSIINLQNNKLTVIQSGSFTYLPNLVSLDLSNNKISSFDRDSILYLPKLGMLAINANPLNCDCEMRAFRQSINARQGDVLVITAKCEGTNIRMTDLSDSQFGSCSDDLFKTVKCMNCKNVRSTEECVKQNFTTTCSAKTTSRPTCFEELVYVSSGLMINKGCTSYSQCLESERNNADQCYGQPTARCKFCCVGELCNKPALKGRLHTSAYMVKIVVNADIPDSLSNPGLIFYTTFVTAVQSQIDNALNNRADSFGSFVSTVTVIESPKRTINVKVVITTIEEVDSDNRSSFIKKQIPQLSHLYSPAFPILSTDVTLLDGKCPAETTSDTKGQFQWKPVFPAEISTVPCSGNSGASATRICSTDQSGQPVWNTPDTSSCQYINQVTQSLTELANTNVDSSNANSIQSDLLSLSRESPSFTDIDISLSMEVIEDLLIEGSLYTNTQKGQDMVETMSNILNSPENVITESETTYQSSERFVKTVESLANGIVPSSGEFTAVKDNLALAVRKSDPNNFSGLTMAAIVSQTQGISKNGITIKDGVDLTDLQSGVIIPSSFFQMVGGNSPRLAFAVYGNNKVFKNAITKNLKAPLVTPINVQSVNAVNAPVISTSVQNTNVQGLKQPVVFRFKHFDDSSDRPQCVFVEPTGSSSIEWSSQGCIVKEHVKGSHTDCECDHLTSFALLMDIYQTGGSLSEANKLALTYISYIGCGVSLLGLLLTLLTYFMFRKLRVNNPSKILINLCMALAVTNVIFLVGMQEYTLDNYIGCKIVAVALHYVLLSAMCWMLIEAFYMYLALIKVFNTYFSHFLLKCCLFGWGMPLIIVAATLGINSTNNYGQQAGGICWLSPVPFYSAFLAPVGIILILNCICFVLVFRVLLNGSSKKITKSDNKSSISQRLKGAIALIVLLGLTWAFAIFSIDGGGIVFQYLFTIFNSLQGLFIFIFYCLLKTEAQQAWKRKFGRAPPKYSGPTMSKERTIDTRSRDATSNTYTSEVSESKKEFTDISKEIDASYPETRLKSKGNTKRYPSYSESNT
ncbi:adhesion G-protein coupled receptor G6-like isoform X1 [Mytilus edulis]|uniref:adhesion G-protein coupled receptor G6-like isoform X1 n=1 Tax=Mytilus edulis TaxID=6550 RepID=UPI0039F09BF7